MESQRLCICFLLSAFYMYKHLYMHKKSVCELKRHFEKLSKSSSVQGEGL